VWRRDVSNPEVIEGLDGGWDVSSQGVLVSKAWEVWRRDVSTPEVIAGVDGGWDVSSQEVLGREGRPRRRDVAAPEGVVMTADGADGTDKKNREEWRQAWCCPVQATLPALCGVSLIREIREIRGPFFAGHA